MTKWHPFHLMLLKKTLPIFREQHKAAKTEVLLNIQSNILVKMPILQWVILTNSKEKYFLYTCVWQGILIKVQEVQLKH